MDLHSTLSISNEETMGSFKFDQFIPALLRFLQNAFMENDTFETLALQCFLYLMDSYPPSGSFLIRFGVVPVLCEKLLNIGGSIDVPEQCIKLLAMMSEHTASGLHILKAGGLAGLLCFIDFFGMDVQLKAVTAASNLVRHIPKESAQQIIDATPHLLNLLQSHHDARVIEKVCLTVSRIVDALHSDVKHLQELDPSTICSALIRHMSISSSGATPETASTANLAVRTLATMCRSCPDLVELLLVQNVPEILRALLNLEQEYAKTKAAQASKMFSAQHVYDIMALVSHLLPPLPSEIAVLLRAPQGALPQQPGPGGLLRALGARFGLEEPVVADKPPASPVPASEATPSETDPRKTLFAQQPHLLSHFTAAILPSLLRVYGSMVNMPVRYKCLVAISKIIHHATPETLADTLKDLTMSAFISSLLSSKDINVVCVSLHMADSLMEKLPKIFSEYFVREGVLHEVDNLIARGVQPPESPSAPAPSPADPETIVGSPGAAAFSPPSPANEEIISTSVPSVAPVPGSPSTPSKVAQFQQLRESAKNLAKSFKQKYFTSSLDLGSSDALRKLKELAGQLNQSSSPSDEATPTQILEEVSKLLSQGISTFEILQSGICEQLLTFVRSQGLSSARLFYKVFSSPASPEASGATILVRELQKAIEKVEKLTVTVNPSGGSGSSGLKYLTYPFKVQLKRAEGETKLKDYGDAVIMIEPLATMQSVKDFLKNRLNIRQNVPDVPTTTTEATEAALVDAMQVDDNGTVPPALTEEKAEPDADANEGSDKVDEEEIQNDSEEHPDSMDVQSVHDVEVSEDHSSRGDLHEPAAPAQKTRTDWVDPSTENSQFEIVFTLDNQEPPETSTVFQILHESALRKRQATQRNSDDDSSSFAHDLHVPLTKMWENVYVLEYRCTSRGLSRSMELAQRSSSASSSVLPSTPASEVPADYISGLSSLVLALQDADPSSKAHAELLRAVGDTQTTTLLQLLRILHELSVHTKSFSGESTSSPAGAIEFVPLREFTNAKLTSKLMRQLQDALMVCAGSLPLWCTSLTSSKSFHFLFPFELRQLLFRAISLGISRALAALQDQLHDATDIRIGRIPRQKVRISRDRMLESAMKVLNLAKGNRGILEVEYFNEVGTGLGPTLEFYTLVSREIQRRDLNVWIDSNSSGSWIDAPSGLFPRPTNPSSVSDEMVKNFEFFGAFAGKAMFDNRLLDIPFSVAFLKRILGLPVDLSDLFPLLPDIVKTLREFAALVEQIRLQGGSSSSSAPVIFKKGTIEDLDLYFVFPGDQAWELVPGGSNRQVTSSNLGEYVTLVSRALVEDGTRVQFSAFKRGFDSVFPMRSIAPFSVDELDSLLCGSMQDQHPWDRRTILEHSRFDHGYSASSKAVGFLVDVLTELTPEQRRKFLKFATGSTRLPPRGFKDMNPKLTFVRKEVDHSSSPDDYMPSVNTCFGYLKLPEYTSKEILKKRLLFAIEHGQDAFSFN